MSQNREIKFRAWSKVNGQMIDGDMLFINDESDGGSCSINETIINIQKNYELMQYSGLKDKNGVEIFEGDIIDCIVIDDHQTYRNTCGVYYNHDGFCVMFYYGHEPFEHSLTVCDSIEVLGNIHQNKELIK